MNAASIARLGWSFLTEAAQDSMPAVLHGVFAVQTVDSVEDSPDIPHDMVDRMAVAAVLIADPLLGRLKVGCVYKGSKILRRKYV